MEGARQFQDRILCDTSRRVGWAYAGRVRRSGDHPQVLFDASCFRIRGASRHYSRGSRPRRTRGNCLARWTETLVTVTRSPSARPRANKSLDASGLNGLVIDNLSITQLFPPRQLNRSAFTLSQYRGCYGVIWNQDELVPSFVTLLS